MSTLQTSNCQLKNSNLHISLTLTFLIAVNLIGPSSSARIRCELAFECANSTTNVIGDIDVYGYKGHIGSLSTLNTNGSVRCDGAFGCSDASSITAENSISCSGSNACTKSPYIHSDTLVFGYGVNALTSATISTTPTTECSGEQTCAYSIIEGSTLIQAGGAYGLLNAVIDSINGTGTLDINLFGYYSGFGSNITCRTGDSCTINCAGNGCTNVHLNCDNNCIIKYNSADTVRAINHSWLDIESILLYDTANITDTLDKECSAQPDAMNYDNYYEAPIGDIIASNVGPLCSRGSYSCVNARNVDYTSRIGETIVASGTVAFMKTNIKSKGEIFCDAWYSCDTHVPSGTINTTGIVYCTAFQACVFSEKITASRVYCSGDSGCYMSSFLSDGNDMDIYLLGYLSGESCKITCNASDTCSIWCYGYKSCQSMTLVCDGICNLYCDADSLCPDGWNATIERPTAVTTVPTARGTTMSYQSPSATDRYKEAAVATSSQTSPSQQSSSPDDDTKGDHLLVILLMSFGVCVILILCGGIIGGIVLLFKSKKKQQTHDASSKNMVIDEKEKDDVNDPKVVMKPSVELAGSLKDNIKEDDVLKRTIEGEKGRKGVHRRVVDNNYNKSCSVDLWSNDHNVDDVITEGGTATTSGDDVRKEANESGDNDDIYIKQNVDNKPEIPDEKEVKTTSGDDVLRKEKAQGTKGDFFYDEHYDQIRKRERNNDVD